MSERLALGQVDVEILAGHDRYEAASVMEFKGEEAAYRFLRGLLDNPRGLDAVRRALAPRDLHGTLRNAGPTELLRRLVREVAEARLAIAVRPPRRLWELPAPRAASPAAGAAPPAAASTPTPVPAEAPTAAPPPEAAPAEATEDEAAEAAADQDVQAEALVDAAQNGVPFCAECAKAAAERAARAAAAAAETPALAAAPAEAPPPDPPVATPLPDEAFAAAETPEEAPDPDPDAQAAVLVQAAADGTPFCEECERARRGT